jgi:RNA methyltransferase, TrmH family
MDENQMTQIESPQNPRLKAVKRLQNKRDRAREGRFVAEGEDLLAAAERAGSRPVEGFRVAVGSAGRTSSTSTRVLWQRSRRWVLARG